MKDLTLKTIKDCWKKLKKTCIKGKESHVHELENNIVKIAIFPQSNLQIQCDPYSISMAFFAEMEKRLLKFI